jgi:hypothetical protein
MHSVAQRYFELSPKKQRQVQVALCEQALLVWESLCNTEIRYTESVAGTTQILDLTLPSEALLAAKSGTGAIAIKQRYLEPLAALQDEDLMLDPNAEFAFYAIYNLFSSIVLKREIDAWLVPNQALSAIGEEHSMAAFERALELVA